jgi:signal transduction histidine kinase/CheY-like chemotaxis protein
VTDPIPPPPPPGTAGSPALEPHLARWLVEESPDPVALALLDGRLFFANRAARAILGLAPETPFSGQTLADLQPAWAWQVVQQEGIPIALGHGAWQGETAGLKPGGGEFPAAQAVLVTGHGEAVRLASILRDLSELKRRDVEGVETTNRYDTAIRLSSHVLLDWEPFTGKMSCSGDLAGVLGRGPEELPNGFRTLRTFVHPDDLARFDQEIQRTVVVRNSLTITFRLQHKDGEYRHVRLSGGFYLDREGRYARIAALLMSVDFLRHAREEVARLEAQLALGVDAQVQEARAETQRALQAKSEFLSRMSHELRTPLNAILGFTQLLELEEPTPRQKESIEHIARAGQHLLSLINEVLDLSRIETGRLPINLASVEVMEVLREAVDLMQATAARDELQLSVADDCPSETAHVLADQQRLRQVLHNLVSNAIKFNRPGGAVAVSWQPHGWKRVRISITDTGEGIATDRLESLFAPLAGKTPAGDPSGGIGLGLAISRGLIQAMHGELGVESVHGQGSTFWIELPLAPGGAVPVAIPESALAESGPPARPLEQKTLLYVEDEDLNLQLVRRVLADYPEYRLITTMQGSLALELAREQKPDLILLDLNLPDVSGETVLAKLKDDPALRDIPVIMVTADVLGHRLERLLGLGAAAYLTKPFKIAEFIRAIRDALAR